MTSITLTNEQFQQLLDRSSRAIPQDGSFAKCSSRFNGTKEHDVKTFIETIQIFKDCTCISDENALRGLPMLLDGYAATWWQGVKATVSSWDAALELLNGTFGPDTPPYRVYRELFSRQQDTKTPVHVFVCEARAILAQLPNNMLTEEIQLDMVYGLLNKKIREKLRRNEVDNFSELLIRAREIEELDEEPSEPVAEKRWNKRHRNRKTKRQPRPNSYSGSVSELGDDALSETQVGLAQAPEEEVYRPRDGRTRQ